VIVATQATLSIGDNIDGGQGVDTLKISASGSVDTSSTLLNSIEKIEVSDVGGVVASVQLLGATALTELSILASDDPLAVSGLASATKVNVIGKSGGNLTLNFTDAAAAGRQTATLALNGSTIGPLTIAGVEAAVISNDVNATTINGLAISAADTLTITSQKDLTLGAVDMAAGAAITVDGVGKTKLTLDADIRAISASGAGALDVTLATGTQSVTGSSGNDRVNLGNVVLSSGLLNGGSGKDTLAISESTATVISAGNKANITGFETLEITGTGKLIDFTALTGLTDLNVAAGTSLTVNNLSANAPVTISGTQTTNLTLNVKDAATVGQLDTLQLTIDDGQTATNWIVLDNLTANGVETFTLNAVDNVQINSMSGAAAMTTLTASGAGDVRLTTGALAVNANTNMSFAAVTGSVTVDASSATANGLNITGSSSRANILTGSAQADRLTGGSGADMLTGGAGNNTFVFAAGALGSAPSDTLFDTITDWRAGANIIDFGATALVSGNGGILAAGQAQISANGLTSFHASDVSLSQHISAAQAAIAASGGAAVAGEFALWQEGADAYLLVSDATAGLGAADVLIKLTGVTLGSAGATLAGGDIIAIS
jgi:hypothetical protein